MRAIFILIALCGTCLADERSSWARVSVQDSIYRLRSEVIVALPPARVRAMLTQYAQLPRFNPGITVVVSLAPALNGDPRLRVEAGACVLMFCRPYRWVQVVHERKDGSIVAEIEPQDSDFRSGTTRYQFVPHGDCTRLTFDAELEPRFWIPPFIGTWLMERKLMAEALETARGVEYHAGVKTVAPCPPMPPHN